MYTLGEWVTIHNGITTVKSGGIACCLLLAKSINAQGIEYSELENTFATSRIKPLQRGDVLVVNRGRFSVGLVGDDVPDRDIAVPSFVFTLRVGDTARVLPAYVHYYLNTRTAQNRMRAMQQGGGIRFISKSDLMAMPIVLPDMPTQRRIAYLYNKVLQAQQLRQQQIQLLDDYINALHLENMCIGGE